eukprot:6152650-Pyramimonas_sp.AAC.1
MGTHPHRIDSQHLLARRRATDRRPSLELGLRDVPGYWLVGRYPHLSLVRLGPHQVFLLGPGRCCGGPGGVQTCLIRWLRSSRAAWGRRSWQGGFLAGRLKRTCSRVANSSWVFGLELDMPGAFRH